MYTNETMCDLIGLYVLGDCLLTSESLIGPMACTHTQTHTHTRTQARGGPLGSAVDLAQTGVSRCRHAPRLEQLGLELWHLSRWVACEMSVGGCVWVRCGLWGRCGPLASLPDVHCKHRARAACIYGPCFGGAGCLFVCCLWVSCLFVVCGGWLVGCVCPSGSCMARRWRRAWG
jgi:hypothetical protein